MSHNIKISVIIPTYNRIALIGRAIESVLSQKTTEGVEIIVVDDGSTDNTVSYITSEYRDVNVLTQKNSGPSAARNRGIMAASGDYIAFLDSDDELVADSLSSRAEVLEMNPTLDLVCGDFFNCRDNRQIGQSNFERLAIQASTQNHVARAGAVIIDNFFDIQLRNPQFITSALMLRRMAISDDDLFSQAITIGEDWEFCLRFSRKHTVAILIQTVVRRHVHGSNLARDIRSTAEAVAVDRIVLSYTGLTASQYAFAKRRLADDLFEYAYARYWSSPWNKELRALVESMQNCLTIPKVKLLIAYCLPRCIARQLQNSQDGRRQP